MIACRVELVLKSLIILFIFVKSQHAEPCMEQPYTVANYRGVKYQSHITLLNCGRVKRSLPTTVAPLPPSSSTPSVATTKATVTNTTAEVANSTKATLAPSVPSKTIVILKGSSTPSVSSTLAPKIIIAPSKAVPTNATNVNTTATSVNATAIKINTTTEATKTNNGQDPTKIDLRIPSILGKNGTGIRHITTSCNSTTASNRTTNTTACVSDPIVPEEGNMTDYDVNIKTPQKLFEEHNITDYKMDNHNYYTSIFINNKTTFDEYWNNTVLKDIAKFETLSLSHRKGILHNLTFTFPFYGQAVDTIVITTGGFIFTGPHISNWLAATQYVAPLMANFELKKNVGFIRFYDNGTAVTVVWNNLTLNDLPNAGLFSFATTLYDDGNITFAYKGLPMTVDKIPTQHHLVKVGLSDAYEIHHIESFSLNKFIFEYHLIDLKNHSIANNTLVRLAPLPTCPQYNTCRSCLENDSHFVCSWCSKVKRCSAGLDRYEHEWYLHNCHNDRIDKVSMCSEEDNVPINRKKNVAANKTGVQSVEGTSSSGIIVSLLLVVMFGGVVGWIVYAYRNPHTNSGQLLIKYRPSQWSWRRGEARYTAATIHM